jgi:uncharacterized cupredoxin-like copper-binding protein
MAVVVFGLLAVSMAAAAAPPPRVIRVVLEEYRITPAAIPLKAGERVRLEILNAGTMRHEFRSTVFRGVDVWVRAAAFDLRAERLEVVVIRPGASAALEFARRTPGEYPFWCGAAASDGRAHRDLGMNGRFVVTP